MSETNGNNLLSLRDLEVHYDIGADPAHLKALRNIINGLVVAIIAFAGIYLLVYLLGSYLPAGVVSGLKFILKAAFAVGVLAIVIIGAVQFFRSIKHRLVVKAVDGVSLEIIKGETLGLVGESGCGKSTLGKAILRLTEPTGGKVFFNGKDLANIPQGSMREQRKSLQMIFQDPYASLNPRMTVGNIIGEPIRTFRLAGGESVDAKVQDLMETVGLSRRFTKRYPHEFSGGQRQRIGIARALAVDPEFIVADEPISALDVSIQAQIMNLMERLQKGKDLTYLFISHDLRAVRHLSDRVAVMYLGKIVELAESRDIYANPLMPYTIALISAVPVPDPEIEAKRERIILKGDVPSPINPPTGCHFHTRCQYAIPECKQIVPQLVEITPRHQAACIRINAEHPHIEENAAAGLGAIGS